MDFRVVSDYMPAGSQPEAISKLVEGIESGYEKQTLLGVTGSGKTYTMAKVIEATQKTALVLSHNKTLAAQLYSEFRDYFPDNAVEYFVSYYDYYQPEAYLPASDTYIEKDADINEEIEKLRHRATASLLDRRDVVVVCTVSAIYGLGSPEEYRSNTMYLKVGEEPARDELIRNLVDMHYMRSKTLEEGTFRVRGAVIDVYPPYGEKVVRVKADEHVQSLKVLHPVSQKTLSEPGNIRLHPAVHYMIPEQKLHKAMGDIRDELAERLKYLENKGRLLEANRLRQKTNYDLEMISEFGYCKGIENYSRHLEARGKASAPYTLMDFLPKDHICFIDESHITVPQVRGMYAGDKSRKETLIEYGFRLPSALDNRPLKYGEFEKKLNQVVYVSATPADYERKQSRQIVEQLIRPTGLVDPEVEVKPAENQVNDFIECARIEAGKKRRVLATTLTKRLSEDLAGYLGQKGLKVKYLHSEIDTLERIEILRQLRKGSLDVVVGVNLLREGLDLPEVSLVAIMDADREGFLRSATSLVQTIGRCSRNVEGKVILYADKTTQSMRRALDETSRRRRIQLAYNRKHGIQPKSITKKVHDRIVETAHEVEKEVYDEFPADEIRRLMKEAADRLEFEQAIYFRKLLEEKGGRR